MMVNEYARLVDELMSELAKLDAEHNQIQTDIYLYVDTDSWRMEEYLNIGGNSWLDDDHILLYQDKPHYEDIAEWSEGMTTEEIAKELLSMYGIEYQYKAWQILDDAGIE